MASKDLISRQAILNLPRYYPDPLDTEDEGYVSVVDIKKLSSTESNGGEE